jgi:hypothetical protein
MEQSHDGHHDSGAAPHDGEIAATDHAQNHADHQQHGGHGKHAGHHVEQFRRRFWWSLLLTIPVVITSEMVMEWFGYELDFRGITGQSISEYLITEIDSTPNIHLMCRGEVGGGAGDGRLETIDVRRAPSRTVTRFPPPRSSYSSAPSRLPNGFRQTSNATTGAS